MTVDTDYKLMEINMGPQHPATHGVLRLKLLLDGETVVKCTPIIGYLHTGIEKTMENKTYKQALTCTDRIDYLGPLLNNLAYTLSIEKLIELEVPEKAVWARVILAELTRLNSHLVWVGTHALDIGAMSMFFYAFREREVLLKLFEDCSGQRMMCSYITPGGLYYELPDNFEDAVRNILRTFPSMIDEYEDLLTNNQIWINRTKGVGIISAEDAINHGLTGPTLRGSGVNYDVRKANPYCDYEKFQFEVPLGSTGDCYDRYLCRIEEMRQSLKIIQQAIDGLPEGQVRSDNYKYVLPPRVKVMKGMEYMIHEFKLVAHGMIPPRGEAYVPIESGKGELGFYIVSDGTKKPYRVKVRPPCFVNLSAIHKMVEGKLIADVIAVIGSIDIVLGEIDR
ncbi:MAG: NADH dehydrogenase (quinone) subunit D [candidate division Zixibacteria bacterium]|nr:NADH dehydrogenase (quinone) subunit D [candidate division Zixibacteria bacterium]